MSAPQKQARLGAGVLIAVALGAFAFTFALVPLYRIACEQVLGIRLEQGPSQTKADASNQPTREITVQFDGGVNSKLPWGFGPKQLSMKVRVGQQYETMYFARNQAERAIVGSAVPSVAPARASAYFNKTECFCFTAQTLQAGETRDMPVRFVVDPSLPKDINTLTLSYTFFKNDVLTAQLQAPSGSVVARAAP